MKKLILLILLLAFVFAGNYVFGQAVHNSYPIPLTGCETGPLNPIAGTSYNYSAVVNPLGGSFQWWATTDQNFISGGVNNIGTQLTVAAGELLATSANYGISDPQDNVDITWASSTLAAATTTPTFVVVQYDAPVDDGCANNLKVMLIEPVNGFTVDIRNMYATYDTVAYGVVIDTCVSPIASAVYQAVPNNVLYDFGANQLLFEVVLANFSVGATVSFSIAGLQGTQTADLAWGYSPATAGANSLGIGLPNGVVLNTANMTTNASQTDIGVSIFVLATVNNNTYEGLANVDFTLAVNAENADGYEDVVNSDCTLIEYFEDMATQTINARPGVTTTPVSLPVAP